MTLDLKQPEAREIFRKLIAGADVLVENFPPRRLRGFGPGL
jgi:crotonobetainyl-CoA:carnitine CoA-transferase CaiB-like acyl-CoA transferase